MCEDNSRLVTDFDIASTVEILDSVYPKKRPRESRARFQKNIVQGLLFKAT